jgi:hypothetical protein
MRKGSTASQPPLEKDIFRLNASSNHSDDTLESEKTTISSVFLKAVTISGSRNDNRSRSRSRHKSSPVEPALRRGSDRPGIPIPPSSRHSGRRERTCERKSSTRNEPSAGENHSTPNASLIPAPLVSSPDSNPDSKWSADSPSTKDAQSSSIASSAPRPPRRKKSTEIVNFSDEERSIESMEESFSNKSFSDTEISLTSDGDSNHQSLTPISAVAANKS